MRRCTKNILLENSIKSKIVVTNRSNQIQSQGDN